MTSQSASTNLHLGRPYAAGATAWRGQPPADPARRLQLAVAFLWLLDGVLQFQAFMFGRGFTAMLRESAPGNPAFIAGPVTWSAQLIAQHPVPANTVFAVIQLLIGLGIAWRPALKPALALSVGWSLAVWWLGEGLGGLLTGTASPVSGAPGAVLLYALIAVLLWPRDRAGPGPVTGAPFAAASGAGARAARALWLMLWGGLAVLALLPASRAPRAMSGVIASMSAGQPGWLAGLDRQLAHSLSRHGPAAAVILAVALAVIAAGIYLPRRAVRTVLVLAIAVAAALWVAQGLGGVLTGSATDPDSGPLLALLALCFWPHSGRAPTSRPAPAEAPAGAGQAAGLAAGAIR
jgi:hypothetical protein